MIRDSKPPFEGKDRCPKEWANPSLERLPEGGTFLSGLRYAADWGLEFEYTEYYIKFRLEGHSAAESRHIALAKWDI